MEKTLKPVQVAALEAFCLEAMRRCGMRAADARLGADVLVTTDAWGVYSHGTKALRQYLRRMRAGGLDAQAQPRVVAEGPAWALMDGGHALAMVSGCRGMEVAIAKARQAGLGFVSLNRGGHFGAAGYYAQLALPHDMLGIAMSNSDPNMTVPGGRGKIIGNNPLAYAIPAGAEQPLVLDMALSAVAAGKVDAAREAGRRIPETWLVDEHGLPTTDPALYPLKACLVPMAGHKGYGLALLVEALAGVMSGAGLLREVKSWMLDDPSRGTEHGHAFIAVNVGAMMPLAEFKARVDQVIREIRGSQKAQGSDRIYLPGEMEWERREAALKNGIPLPPEVRASLRGLATDLDLQADWL